MATALLIEPPLATEQAYFKPDEAAKYLRCGVRTLRDGVNHSGFPHSRIGKALVFSKADLDAIYQRFRVANHTPARRRRRAA